MSSPSAQTRRRLCRRCDRYVFTQARPFDASLHGALVVLTCGLWAPVALAALVWRLMGGYRCPNCGRRCG